MDYLSYPSSPYKGLASTPLLQPSCLVSFWLRLVPTFDKRKKSGKFLTHAWDSGDTWCKGRPEYCLRQLQSRLIRGRGAKACSGQEGESYTEAFWHNLSEIVGFVLFVSLILKRYICSKGILKFKRKSLWLCLLFYLDVVLLGVYWIFFGQSLAIFWL